MDKQHDDPATIAAGLPNTLMFLPAVTGKRRPLVYDSVKWYGVALLNEVDEAEFLLSTPGATQDILNACEIVLHNRSQGSLDSVVMELGEFAYPAMPPATGVERKKCVAFVLCVRGRKLNVKIPDSGVMTGPFGDVRLFGSPEDVYKLLISFRTVLTGADRCNAVVQANQMMMQQAMLAKQRALKPGELKIVTDVLKPHGE